MEPRLLGAYALIALLMGFFAWLAWRLAMGRVRHNGHGRSMRERWLAPQQDSAPVDPTSPS